MQHDYILRIIQQFVLAITAIVQKRKEGNYIEATESIKTASRTYLRADIELILLTHTPDQIVDYFKDFTDHIDCERSIFFADLLHELCFIYKAQKLEAESIRLKKMCLHLYTTGIPKKQAFQTQEYFEKVANLTEDLKDITLSEKILISLHAYDNFHKNHQHKL